LTIAAAINGMQASAHVYEGVTSSIRQIRTSILFGNGKEGPCQSARPGALTA
jgi:hypothetical protein